MHQTVKIILNFIVLLVVQILILNNIQLFGVVNPYLYVLVIISLPVAMSQSLMMLIAFLLGLIIDVFGNSYGIHTAATVLVAFLRPYIMGLFASREDMEQKYPSYRNFGMSFYKYAALMVVIHHFTLFSIEAFSFAHEGVVLLKTLCSSAVTMMLIIGIHSINFKRR